jgi:hypothetical protein
MDLLDSVGENFDVNIMMKEFPADKPFIVDKKQNIRAERFLR